MLTRTETLVCINTEIQSKLLGTIKLLCNMEEHETNMAYNNNS